MDRFSTTTSALIETPSGWMGRSELREFATHLSRVEATTRHLVINWSNVTHLDYRGIEYLTRELRLLRERGVDVLGYGLGPYLQQIFRFALSLDDMELFDGEARPDRPGPADDSPALFPRCEPWGSPHRLSRN